MRLLLDCVGRKLRGGLMKTRTGYVLKLQKGQCPRCGRSFQDGDQFEVDHIIPRRWGGDDQLMNLQLLHRHCHDQKTAQDGSNRAKVGQGINDNDHLVEEPDEAKVSCPVWGEGWGKPHGAIGVWRPCPYSTGPNPKPR